MITDRQKELTDLLDKAAKAYEQDDREIMSNFEYDRLYDELLKLEQESGAVLSNSPTHKAGYEVLSELPKFKHETPCLSLDKTKSVDALTDWIKDKEAVLSWKMDGLTVVLTYENGELVRAVTRGNGLVGEIITNNAKVFKNIPLKIDFKGSLTIRGEAVIKYSDFEKINDAISNPDEKYKNPRNLCSGTVRQLNNEITANRNVNLFAFTLYSAEGDEKYDTNFKTIEEGFLFLEKLGFEVVERKIVNATNLAETVKWFSEKVKTNDFPSDGLVVIYNDIAYGNSLGTTAKYPRNALAFKWQDETARTNIREVFWSASRTGLINPVAVFDPVELEGTTVTRASVHNVSIVEELKLGIGDEVSVYKANMIIPQIAENFTGSGTVEIPKKCPVCGGDTEIKDSDGNRFLYCINPDCTAKKIKSFSHFVERDAMNMDGISEQTLEKFIAEGFVHEYADLYKLAAHKDQIVEMEGFGEKSFEKIINSVEEAKHRELSAFIYALGIPNVGNQTAKILCAYADNDIAKLRSLTKEELTSIDTIGDVIADSFIKYMAEPKYIRMVDDLLEFVEFVQPEASTGSALTGYTFVITGSLEQFENRNALKKYIELNGGKVTGSVTKNTNFLINNDVNSNSTKNKTARALGTEIISEQDFIDRFGQP